MTVFQKSCSNAEGDTAVSALGHAVELQDRTSPGDFFLPRGNQSGGFAEAAPNAATLEAISKVSSLARHMQGSTCCDAHRSWLLH